MKILTILKNITKPLHQSIYEDKEEYMNNYFAYMNKYNNVVNQINDYKIEIEQYNKDLENASKIIEKLSTQTTNPEIETYLLNHFKEIPNIANSKKRIINDEYVSIFLNQLITPDAFLVMKLKKSIKIINNTNYGKCKAYGDAITKFTYAKDKDLHSHTDYYDYPEEVITLKSGDCESLSCTTVSLEPEIMAFCRGLHKGSGHSWVIFLGDNKLYEMEVTGHKPVIWEYGTNPDYKAYEIITKNKTYRNKSGVNFGERCYL